MVILGTLKPWNSLFQTVLTYGCKSQSMEASIIAIQTGSLQSVYIQMIPHIIESSFSISLSPPSQSRMDSLLGYFSKSIPESKTLRLKQFTKDRLIAIGKSRVTIMELSKVQTQAGVSFGVRADLQNVEFYYNDLQNYFYEHILTVQDSGLQLFLFDYVKKTYKAKDFKATNPLLFAKMYSSNEILISTQQCCYLILISNNKLMVAHKFPYETKLKTACFARGEGLQVSGISDSNQINLIQVSSEGLTTKGCISLGQVSQRIKDSFWKGNQCVIILSLSVVLVRFMLQKYQIYNSYDLGFSSEGFKSLIYSQQIDMCALHIHNRVQFYRIEQQANMVQLLEVQVHEGHSLQTCYNSPLGFKIVFIGQEEGNIIITVNNYKAVDSLEEKCQKVIRFRDLSVGAQEQLMVKLGLQQRRFYQLAWENSQFNQWAIQKLLLKTCDYSYYRDSIQIAFKYLSQRGLSFKVPLLLKIHKAGHELLLSQFSTDISMNRLRMLLESAFIIKKLGFFRNKQISQAQYQALEQLHLCNQLRRMVDTYNVIQFVEFINNFKLSMLFNFEQFIKTSFQGFGKDIAKLSQQFFYLLPSSHQKSRAILEAGPKFRIQDCEKKQLQKKSETSFVIFNGLWTSLKNYECNYYFFHQTLHSQLLKNCPEVSFQVIDNLLADFRNQQWYQQQKLTKLQFVEFRQQALSRVRSLCGRGAYMIFLEVLVKQLPDYASTQKVLIKLMGLQRFDPAFFRILKFYASFYYIVSAHRSLLLRELESPSQQDWTYFLLQGERVEVIEELQQSLMIFLESKLQRGRSLCERGRMEEEERRVLKKYIERISLQNFFTLYESTNLKQFIFFQSDFYQAIRVLREFLPSFQLGRVSPSAAHQLSNLLFEVYFHPSFDTQKVIFIEDVTVPLINPNNLVSILLYLDQSFFKRGAQTVMVQYFKSLCLRHLFFQVEDFIASQQENVQLDLNSICIKAVQQIFEVQFTPSYCLKSEFLNNCLSLTSFDFDFFNLRTHRLALAILLQEWGIINQPGFFKDITGCILINQIKIRTPQTFHRFAWQSANQLIAMLSKGLTTRQVQSLNYRVKFSAVWNQEDPSEFIKEETEGQVLLLWSMKLFQRVKPSIKQIFLYSLTTDNCSQSLQLKFRTLQECRQCPQSIQSILKERLFQTCQAHSSLTKDSFISEELVRNLLSFFNQHFTQLRKNLSLKMALLRIIFNPFTGIRLFVYQSIVQVTQLQKVFRKLLKLQLLKPLQTSVVVFKAVLIDCKRKEQALWFQEQSVISADLPTLLSQQFSEWAIGSISDVQKYQNIILLYYYKQILKGLTEMINMQGKQFNFLDKEQLRMRAQEILANTDALDNIKSKLSDHHDPRFHQTILPHNQTCISGIAEQDASLQLTSRIINEENLLHLLSKSQPSLPQQVRASLSQSKSSQVIKRFQQIANEQKWQIVYRQNWELFTRLYQVRQCESLSELFGAEFFLKEQDLTPLPLFRLLKPRLISQINIFNYLSLASTLSVVQSDFSDRIIVYFIQNTISLISTQSSATSTYLQWVQTAVSSLTPNFLRKGRKLQKLRDRVAECSDQESAEAIRSMLNSNIVQEQ